MGMVIESGCSLKIFACTSRTSINYSPLPQECLYPPLVGNKVPLELMNELLALLAFKGPGNKKASQHSKSQMMIKWPPLTPERTGENDKAEEEALENLDMILREVKSTQTGEWCYVYTHSIDNFI